MDTSKLLGLLFVVILGLSLTPAIIDGMTDAQYGLSKSDSFSHTGATYTAVLTYGNVRPGTAYIHVTVNGTAHSAWTLTVVGNYVTPGQVSLTGMGIGANVIVISYTYLVAAVQVTLLGLMPLLWVVMIVAAVVLVVVHELKL